MNIFDYSNSWRHAWDWSLRFPYPKWWTTTLPEIFSNTRWSRAYLSDKGPSPDLIQRIFRLIFFLKNKFKKS